MGPPDYGSVTIPPDREIRGIMKMIANTHTKSPGRAGAQSAASIKPGIMPLLLRRLPMRSRTARQTVEPRRAAPTTWGRPTALRTIATPPASARHRRMGNVLFGWANQAQTSDSLSYDLSIFEIIRQFRVQSIPRTKRPPTSRKEVSKSNGSPTEAAKQRPMSISLAGIGVITRCHRQSAK